MILRTTRKFTMERDSTPPGCWQARKENLCAIPVRRPCMEATQIQVGVKASLGSN